MKKYTVTRREVHNSYVQVGAESEGDALRKVADGEGNEVLCEFSWTMDPETWDIKEDE